MLKNNLIQLIGDAPQNPPEKISWQEMIEVAFNQACMASANNEVPVGAALFSGNGDLIATGQNRPIQGNDPTSHAEIECLREACRITQNYRIPAGSILAVTLEPCIMCMGAIIHARVSGIVFGAYDKKAGALISNLSPSDINFLNHKVWAVGGISENKCRELLQSFFLRRRKRPN
ncbi:nucleoside deaminase [Maridesulfovibrio bastinii]|uniref:nucleoside deaminase n=1 Tax=Maridesulfovibrio bastinii TaxID=47157 RepID=UPI0003FE051E|nr:nucleoside deaminase [Maridesulfovibrio bastinii]